MIDVETAIERTSRMAFPDNMEDVAYVNDVMEALQLQRPMKLFTSGYKSRLMCGRCKRGITNVGCLKPNVQYCPGCGQKILWE